MGRALLAFGLLNLLLAFLPAWDVAGNGERMVAAVLPLTILWSYAAFTLNVVLAIAVYVLQFKPWAERADDRWLDRPEPRRSEYEEVTRRPGLGGREGDDQ